MQENTGCTHDCASCGENCPSRTQAQQPESFLEAPHPASRIGKVIGVVSGKGGVGKSMVTCALAVLMNRRGHHAAVLDADITGPSVPQAFGIHEHAMATDVGILPARSKTGIDVMSVNLLLENEKDPVIWRGPVLAGVVKQFWSEVIWKDVDYMFVDMPPGTGDVPLTVFQSVPLDGIIVVTSPQQLVGMIVSKALGMAGKMDIPVLGLVENMSYIECPDCHKQLKPFGESNVEAIAQEYGTRLLARMPLDYHYAQLCDKGLIEMFNSDCLDPVADAIEAL